MANGVAIEVAIEVANEVAMEVAMRVANEVANEVAMKVAIWIASDSGKSEISINLKGWRKKQEEGPPIYSLLPA